MPSVYLIAEDVEGGYEPRGAAKRLWQTKAHEVLIAGPSETGKTLAACHKLDALLWRYPGAQATMLRKRQTDLYATCLRTYRQVVGADKQQCPLAFYGGEKPEHVQYPNGSRLWFGGLDKPGKVLSSERDFIFVNQAEELTLSDWEFLTTRCTGRGAVAPYTQLVADANPGPPTHWLLKREQAGHLEHLKSRHEDNPTLYDADGNLTAQGRLTIATLDALTGVRYYRLRLGIWAGAEGLVYDTWDPAVNVVPAFDIPNGWRHFRCVDFGFTNPFVCQWWAVDPDGRMYLYREIYRTQRIVRDHAQEINRLTGIDRMEVTVCDHDAEDRATLESEGIATMAAYKAVTVGIEGVQARIRKAADGRPRLFVMDSALVERDAALDSAHKPVCTAQEFEIYAWAQTVDGRPIKEEPVKMNDHGMDAMRYAVAYVDNLGDGAALSASDILYA